MYIQLGRRTAAALSLEIQRFGDSEVSHVHTCKETLVRDVYANIRKLVNSSQQPRLVTSTETINDSNPYQYNVRQMRRIS
jgi:hypothetical protein